MEKEFGNDILAKLLEPAIRENMDLFMRFLFEDTTQADHANVKYLCDKFGTENCMMIYLHSSDKTHKTLFPDALLPAGLRTLRFPHDSTAPQREQFNALLQALHTALSPQEPSNAAHP